MLYKCARIIWLKPIVHQFILSPRLFNTYIATNAHQGTEGDCVRYHCHLLHLVQNTEGVVDPLGMSCNVYQCTEEDLQETETPG